MSKEPDNSFRDHINTTNEEGRRSWIYAKAPKGKLHTYRVIVGLSLLSLFFLIPHLHIGNQPFLLLNLFERKFVILGQIFRPQDFYLFVIGLITLIIGIVLFTVIYGRVWCGWVCPQTLFLEIIFRKIEFLIEGNPNQQQKLDQESFSLEKAWKKSLKHIIYLSIAILAIHNLASYLVGTEKLFDIIHSGPSANTGAFFAITIITGVFYFVFARFREQVCTLVCPYGRLQGVMLDANSLVVAYDFKRGEDRAKKKKGEERESLGKGDCIDCGNCVSVCPTGIDIRNGTQLECINCTACIDSCNEVMGKIGFKPGLIRIASYNEITEGRKFRFTTRIAAYTLLLIGLITAMIILFATRNETETTILRVPGTLHQDMGDSFTNIYNISIRNKSDSDFPIEIKTLNIEGKVQLIGKPINAIGQETAEGVFLLYLDKSLVSSSKIPVTFGLFVNGELIEKEKATFVGP